jgi:hypothetical protein
VSGRYQDFHERFAESNDRFQEAMLQAIRAHQQGVAILGDLLGAVGEHERQLEESVEELKQLILAQGVELRALRERLNGSDRS